MRALLLARLCDKAHSTVRCEALCALNADRANPAVSQCSPVRRYESDTVQPTASASTTAWPEQPGR